MADTTISSLPLGTPSGNLIVPISDGNNTYRAPLSDIQVNYNSLTNKPTIPATQIQSDWTQANTESLDFIKNKPNNAQLIKAWVNWKGDTYNAQNECTINASYNISKVVRNSSGRYTVYFSNPSPVSNQYYVLQGGVIGTAGAGTRWLTFGSTYINHTGKSTTSFVCECSFTYVDTQDASEAWVSVIGN